MRLKALLLVLLVFVPLAHASLEHDLDEGDVDNKTSSHSLSRLITTAMKWTPAQLFLEITTYTHGGYITLLGTGSGGGAQQETLQITDNGLYESIYYYIAVDEMVFHPYGCTFHYRLYQDPTVKGAGLFVLSVQCKQGSLMLKDVSVTVKALDGQEPVQNQTTDYLGVAQFQLSYGNYLVQAHHNNKIKTMRVWLRESKTVGFEFRLAPARQSMFEVFIIGSVAGVLGVLLFLRLRR